MSDEKNKRAARIQAGLGHFSGDLERYRSIIPGVIYTPGVKFLADEGHAHWLIDAIASWYPSPRMRKAIASDHRLESLHFWRLDVHEDDSATLTMRADSGEQPAVTQEIPYTDFPLESIAIWAGPDRNGWVLYLPSEH